jgi:hypothetical protein
MNPEREIERIAQMSDAEIRQRIAIAWRNMRRDRPEVARMLWKMATKKEQPNA